MSKTFGIRVYEIEHDGDLENAERWIRQAGATSVTVRATDFENSESAVFEVQVPEEKVERFREIWKQTEFMMEARS
jgi:hypothetical protein